MTAEEQQKKIKEKIEEFISNIRNQCPDDSPVCDATKDEDCDKCYTKYLLSLLASLGVVIKSEEQGYKLHDMDSALFAEGYAAAVGDMEQSGFVKVIPVKGE